ncbi:hypothetical protein A4X09_0g4228 [Tilletia walkeri]|uniref:40S ribosomal protein S25 n=1 Tax=Tilletia walkeri TaxID=117179 RepID=A0A8X7N7V9_9BASI|nr:hypothetical protein A4X09_0g4228 [Tilletia walkeri]
MASTAAAASASATQQQWRDSGVPAALGYGAGSQGVVGGMDVGSGADEVPPKKAAILASATKSNKKKKWSKGKVKDKAANAVVLDRPLYDRILKEVPTFKMISQSTLVDRLKINGSLARVAIKHLEREGQIKRIIHHHSQLVYTRTSGE